MRQGIEGAHRGRGVEGGLRRFGASRSASRSASRVVYCQPLKLELLASGRRRNKGLVVARVPLYWGRDAPLSPGSGSG